MTAPRSAPRLVPEEPRFATASERRVDPVPQARSGRRRRGGRLLSQDGWRTENLNEDRPATWVARQLGI